MRYVAALVALAFSAPLVASNEREVADLVKEDIAIEAAECGAYFVLNAEGMRRSLPAGQERDKEVADWMRFSNEALNLSVSLSSKERTKAVVELATEKIKRMTKGTYENWTIAAAEYAYRCKDLMDDPKARWQYWLNKERAAAPK